MQAQTLSSGIGKPRRHRATAARGAKSCAPRVNLFQIAYSPRTFADIEGGYRVLDNRANPRPDWYEYWPMREYLLNQPLDDQAFYGFFSTKFHNKTGLTHAEVLDFVEQQAENTDIVLFSPQPDMGAFFLNVFEQGELFDPGFIDAFNAYLLAIGRPTKVADLLMDSRHIVFSNYFVAKPAFWREWLAITEKTFAICEGPDCPLKGQLCLATSYPGSVQRKVFVQERIASFLLSTQPRWRSVAYNPFGMAWSLFCFRQQPHEAFISDALKLAYEQHRYPQYLEAYGAVRERLKNGGVDQASPQDSLAPGQVVAVRHSFWSGYLIIDQKPGRLRHALHGSQASYRLFGKSLLVDWDDYDAELFVRHGDGFRLSTFERDGRGLDALGQAWTTLGETRLDIESVCLRLPDGMGSAHVRPGTSDITVLQKTCLGRDDDIVGLPDDCDIIVDLGANVGLASIVLAQRYPQATIVAVEPARDDFRLLTKNVLGRPRIIAVEAAIAPCDGHVDLRDQTVSGGETQSRACRTVERGTGLGSKVEALSMPTLMRRYGLGFVDVLKIDIAGAEHALFAENTAAWLPRVRSILIETHEGLVPGTDALVTAVLREAFVEMPSRSGCRFFLRRSWGQGEQ